MKYMKSMPFFDLCCALMEQLDTFFKKATFLRFVIGTTSPTEKGWSTPCGHLFRGLETAEVKCELNQVMARV